MSAKFTIGLVLLFLTLKGIAGENVQIIPAPMSVTKYDGSFVFNAGTLILIEAGTAQELGFLTGFLKDKMQMHNRVLRSSFGQGREKTLLLTGRGAEKLPEGGYQLSISSRQIILRGKGAGLFYAIQSLFQLFPVKTSQTIQLPCMVIRDQPRFVYRGMMLDVSRHFFKVEEVKKVIDLMARYKLNNFHWHLTDNQGWRIEIKKYPKLTAVGGYRLLTKFHDNRDWFDQIKYGGFYTQEQIREVVKYAALRHINIIPEIEMPGHSMAALTAYPEFKVQAGLNAKDQELYDVLYAPTEKTFSFLTDVLTEVATLFPGKYIHIGGDEVRKEPWKNSAYCQELIHKLGLKDEDGLQGYFIKRIAKHLNAIGKQLIGWDEILEGGIADNAVIMSWRGEHGGIAAARQKHEVIMSPETNGMYFDVYQSKSETEPVNRWGYAPIAHTYSYDPLPNVLSKQEQDYILGVQANVWTEWIATPAKLEYMILPRMLALAEVAWSPVAQKDFQRFYHKAVPIHLARLESEGFNYRVPEVTGVSDTTMIGADFTFKLNTNIPGAKIFYTLNGRVPDDTDLQYQGPLRFLVPEGERRELRTLVITPAGRRSIASHTVMYNQAYLPATIVPSVVKGLKYSVLTGDFCTPEGLEAGTVKERGTALNFDISAFRKAHANFGLIYDGLMRIDSTGIYHFSIASVDGAQLFIDDQKVVDNARPHERFERSGAVPLVKGYHKIKLKYNDSGKPKYLLKVSVWGAGTQQKKLDVNQLIYHETVPSVAILPRVYDSAKTDVIGLKLRSDAALAAKSILLPKNKPAWKEYRERLKKEIIKKTGLVVDHELPLNMKQTGTVQMQGYEIRNISFQTRPGVYATANLFVPDGKGPFPAVITMSGHSVNGRLYDKYQSVGHTLALSGYVSLNIDPWGAGERTTTHGAFEYHGANLGVSLMDVGETLMGMQLTDNIRGLDLLESMPFVDRKNIGATGASGGGNQTMYLAAMDERVKAAVPVVSVGTFESYVMRNNCICELLVDGLTFTEEAGILAMVAPRAIRICNGLRDSNPTFYPAEMLRSFKNARPVFEMFGAADHINYQVFDLPHGYEPKDRQAMLGWFNLHLKGIGDGALVAEQTLPEIPEEKLMVFAKGHRDLNVESTVAFCSRRARELKSDLNDAVKLPVKSKRNALNDLLRPDKDRTIKRIKTLSNVNGWDRIVLETAGGEELPLLHRYPKKAAGDYVVLCHPGGKDSIGNEVIDSLIRLGKGVVIADLWGTGENGAAGAALFDSKMGAFHTLSRSSLWLGSSVMGKWVRDMELILKFLQTSQKAKRITIDAAKETAMAALFLTVFRKNIDQIVLRDAPLSYHLNGLNVTGFFSMAIHLPGILVWGDISLAAAMSQAKITFLRPRSIQGTLMTAQGIRAFESETEQLKKQLKYGN